MVCNSGASLVPSIDGSLHHFNNVGLYDALFVMQDTETKTLWNHITGEALYGPLAGRTLGPIGNLLPMNVKQALESDPRTQIAISDQPYLAGGKQFGSGGAMHGGAGTNGPASNAKLSDMFVQTLGKEDTRRPRMDLGLGVWSSESSRYYPLELIRKRGRAFIDRIDGKRTLIYIDPETNNPAAVFVNASAAQFAGSNVRLDDGTVLRAGVLLDRRGKPRSIQRPLQMFTRWYGFALTFPGSQVVGQ